MWRFNFSLIYRILLFLLVLICIRCQEKETPPVAEFEADSTVVEQGGTVQFSDLSLHGPTEWSWRFEAGDPQISSLQNPEVTYYHSGDYEVRLTVTNDFGTDVIIKDNYISVLQPFPTAEFVADSTEVEIDGIVRFTDMSTGKPAEWAWTFQGGNPETSTAQHPKVIYESPGIYTVVLTVKNDRGTDTEAKEDYITVRYPRTDITFRNNVFTDINLVLNGKNYTVKQEDSITFDDFEGFEVFYSAETSGKTAGGDIVGLAVTWSGQLVLNGGRMAVDLDLARDYFYIYITNNGTHDLGPFYVNYGLTDQTVDNVIMKADGRRYRTGYYRANSGTKVRALWQEDANQFEEWSQGTDFSLPFVKNQVIYLVNTNRK